MRRRGVRQTFGLPGMAAFESAEPCSPRNHGRSQSEWSAAAKRAEQEVEEEEKGRAETSTCPGVARERLCAQALEAWGP